MRGMCGWKGGVSPFLRRTSQEHVCVHTRRGCGTSIRRLANFKISEQHETPDHWSRKAYDTHIHTRIHAMSALRRECRVISPHENRGGCGRFCMYVCGGQARICSQVNDVDDYGWRGAPPPHEARELNLT